MNVEVRKMHSPPETYRVSVSDIGLADSSPISITLCRQGAQETCVTFTKRVVDNALIFSIDDQTYPIFRRSFGTVSVGDLMDVMVDDSNTPPVVFSLSVVG